MSGPPPSTADQKERPPAPPLGPLKLPEGLPFSLLYSDMPAALEHEIIEETARTIKDYLKGEGAHRSLPSLAAFVKSVAANACSTLGLATTGSWHCIVGLAYGSYVSHESGSMLFFSVGPVNVLVWKHG